MQKLAGKKMNAEAIKKLAKQTIEIERDAVGSLISRVDDNFVKAAETIKCCKGKLVIIGMGKAGHVGEKLAASFSSLGSPSFFMHPAEAVHGDLGMVAKSDVILAISNSGGTKEVLNLIPTIKKIGAPIISIVGNTNSVLAKESDIVLDASVEREADPLNLAPTASSTAELALGDALAVAVSQAKCFTAKDFACLHPGGKLGEKLLGNSSLNK
ncbi:MAG: SIS domain-containing protein [Candidatus Thermoplasmatota archaeon]|nr:SIS domain-containing protein [Candidatus Thermoplasmatota archaeon]